MFFCIFRSAEIWDKFGRSGKITKVKRVDRAFFVIFTVSKIADSSLFARKTVAVETVEAGTIESVCEIDTLSVFCASMKLLGTFIHALFADSSVSMKAVGRFALAFVAIHQVDALRVTVALVRAQNTFIDRRDAEISVSEKAGFARTVISASSIFARGLLVAPM